MTGSEVLTVFLTHQPREAVERMVAGWREHGAGRFLIAHGGSRACFEEMESLFPEAFLVDDPRLRTRDHQRERQSYQGVFTEASRRLPAACRYVHVAEFDEVPLISDVPGAYLRRMREERADVLMVGLKRVDGTGDPAWLFHFGEAGFGEFWEGMSRRRDAGVVLSALGCGSFWRREAFEAVADLGPNIPPVYLELFLPTAAHHLGFRVRDLPDQCEFFLPARPWRIPDLPALRAAGAWVAHPVKSMWSRPATGRSPCRED